MAVSYNNDVLVAGIKRRGMIPSSQSTFLPVSLLDIANDEMNNEITPLLLSMMGNYLVDYTDHAMTTVSDNEFPVPPAAIGMKLKDVTLISPNSSGQLPPIQEQSVTQLSNEGVNNYWNFTGLYNPGFFLRGNNVILFPQGQPNYSLRLYYYRRPNKLVPVDTCAKVASVDSGLNTVTVESIPSSWANGTDVCCISSTPGFKLVFESQAIQNLSSFTFELASVEDVEVGDYICLEGESAIAQIPVECQPVLEQAACVKVLESLGDPKWKDSQAKYQAIKDNFLKACEPRVDNEPKKIVPKYSTWGWNGGFNGWWD